MESSDKEDYKAKEKAFYSAMISAWLTTRLERDKQLLGLSVTAIGLLVTLLRTVGVSSPLQIILFGLALFAFLITVVLVIYILGENSTHIEKILGGSEIESRKLMCLDKTAGISFVVGMVLIVIIGMDSAGFFQFLCGNDVGMVLIVIIGMDSAGFFQFLCGNDVYSDSLLCKIVLKVLPNKHFTMP